MANGTRMVFVEDFGSYTVSSGLSAEEVRRQMVTLLGAPWLSSAAVCTRANGDLEFKRPAAGAKG